MKCFKWGERILLHRFLWWGCLNAHYPHAVTVALTLFPLLSHRIPWISLQTKRGCCGSMTTRRSGNSSATRWASLLFYPPPQPDHAVRRAVAGALLHPWAVRKWWRRSGTPPPQTAFIVTDSKETESVLHQRSSFGLRCSSVSTDVLDDGSVPRTQPPDIESERVLEPVFTNIWFVSREKQLNQVIFPNKIIN